MQNIENPPEAPQHNLEQDVDFIKRILVALHQRSYGRFERQEGPWSRNEIYTVCSTFQPSSSIEWLERRLPSMERPRGRLLDGAHLIFLDFVEKEKALPILDMRWDLHRQPEVEIRFRFFLLHWKDGEERPWAIGFRLEAPEGQGAVGGDGTHNFWHGQMSLELEREENHIQKLIGERVPGWIPLRQPAFPLPAQNIGDLLAVLLISLYGMKQLRKFSDLDGFADLSQRLRGMDLLS